MLCNNQAYSLLTLVTWCLKVSKKTDRHLGSSTCSQGRALKVFWKPKLAFTLSESCFRLNSSNFCRSRRWIITRTISDSPVGISSSFHPLRGRSFIFSSVFCHQPGQYSESYKCDVKVRSKSYHAIFFCVDGLHCYGHCSNIKFRFEKNFNGFDLNYVKFRNIVVRRNMFYDGHMLDVT
jgi:hypothetical protein